MTSSLDCPELGALTALCALGREAPKALAVAVGTAPEEMRRGAARFTGTPPPTNKGGHRSRLARPAKGECDANSLDRGRLRWFSEVLRRRASVS
jgi:hypothetical protein